MRPPEAVIAPRILVVQTDRSPLSPEELRRNGLSPEMATKASFAETEILKQPYDLVLWRISSISQDIVVLRNFLERNLSKPPVVVVAAREKNQSYVEDTLLELVNGGIRDFVFDDELPLLQRVIRRILIEQAQIDHDLQVDIDTPEAAAALLQGSPLSIIALSPRGIVLLWNRAAEKTFGWRSEEVVGKPLPTVPVEYEHEFHMLLESQLHGTAYEAREVVRRRKDGTLVDMSLWTAPLRDRQGRIRAKLAILADISERRHAEQERLQLLTSERNAREQIRAMDRFRELLEAAPDGIIEVDPDGKIVLLNAATQRLFGYSREELLGESVDMLVPVNLRQRHAEHRSRYLSNPVSRPMGSGLQLYGRRKDGSEFPVEISLSPVRSAEGFRASAIIRDVSERKRAEQLMREMHERFTSALSSANHELELRNQKIEEANRIKSEFLASMSHELRTPLHTIVGFSELLTEELEGPLNDRQKRFMQYIHNDSLHLLELINGILDLSKIEAGKLELNLQMFDSVEVIREVMTSIAPLARAKSTDVELQGCTQLMIKADKVRFKQILFNVVSNALKFTPERGRVGVHCSEKDGFSEFCVSDTGPGIPESEQAAVFEKFHQAGSTQRGVREGTGLGLAITKHLVEQHGGRIWVHSKSGSGSRFYFTIPA
jgi:PAS domain S-box-containing protein